MTWDPATFLEKDRLNMVKVQLHHIVQSCAAFGRHFLPESAEDENAVISWIPEYRMMVGKWVESENGLIRAGLDATNKSLTFQVKDGPSTQLNLQGKTFAQLMMWLEGQAGEHGLAVDKFSADLPYEIPDFPSAKGQTFELEDDEALEAFLSLYGNAHHACSIMQTKFASTSDIRIWPHHFDIAISVKLKESGSPDTSTYLGLGFSPGDSHYHEPYFYTNSWPFADDALLHPLENGQWHIEDWVGGALTLSELAEINANFQEEKVVAFYLSSTTQLSSIILQ